MSEDEIGHTSQAASYLIDIRFVHGMAPARVIRYKYWGIKRWWYKLQAYFPIHHPYLSPIHCPNNYDGMSGEDEQGVLHALQHYDRVHYIALGVPGPTLRKLVVAMDGHFPTPEYMVIFSRTSDNTGVKLPEAFEAPNLRRLVLSCSTFPPRSLLLPTAVGLVILRDDNFVAQLSLMPKLEKLGIRFHALISDFNIERQQLSHPPMTRTTLLCFRKFGFRGVPAHLEGFSTQTSAPVLKSIGVSFFNQLTFSRSEFSVQRRIPDFALPR
ncbi:hypothetical protein BJV78DRAFT_1285303 [Lactifluus subvellereus]|nr:hypothetical protein BJV78DRAFT_1285303 [Lactifluus subvellereus]